MRAHVFHRENPLSWTLMPEACACIRRFCQEVGTDSSEDWVIEALWQQFVSEKPTMLLIAGLGPPGVVGHVLLDIQRLPGEPLQFGRSPVAVVLQLAIDRGVSMADLDREIALNAGRFWTWMNQHNVQMLRGLARNDAAARLFRRRYGFRRRWVSMDADISSMSQTCTRIASQRQQEELA